MVTKAGPPDPCDQSSSSASSSASSSCFEILGLDGAAADVTREDVRRAFRKRLVRAHPDRNSGCSRAYDALCAARDAAYDMVDRKDLLACAARYDWRASMRKDERANKRAAGVAKREELKTTPTSPRRRSAVNTSSSSINKTKFGPHESRVTVMTARDDGVVATGEASGRVSVWRADGARVDSCDAPSTTDKTNDAVSILQFNRHHGLVATYVTSKPRFWTVGCDTMSAAAATEVDAHSRRITAAKWFEGVEGAEICDVLVTAALDGTVFVQTFFDGALGPSALASRDGFRAVKAVDALATSADGGAFVVTDVVGNFKLWRVRLENSKTSLTVEPITNIVTWNGFGGVCFARLARSPMAPDSLRLLTTFTDASARQSRVLEWSVPHLENGAVADVRGYVGAIPSANGVIRGVASDFLTIARSKEDDDDDDDADDDDDEMYLLAANDLIFAVDARARCVLYTMDSAHCRALHPSTTIPGAFVSCRVAAARDGVGFDVCALDDGRIIAKLDFTADKFFDDVDDVTDGRIIAKLDFTADKFFDDVDDVTDATDVNAQRAASSILVASSSSQVLLLARRSTVVAVRL
ncbi:predicted protein [Ostreococcus lucimarinus CCE9901]|uniref:J domain-containing protein n=2 Tax=Ostreococcus sp. 'lucimarinus' TaxID=242159 RepID=A4RY87_OSTLU|nr:predicted protein [Ostreococcus lucimarinus CCE9901]ABO96179.1 predicted protein [Ostreococcus lucimarinus CCE9901]|eukprot:XP_001417886.1 predicted protein [Ostreococcus lucimarinus CCE9901]